LVRIYEMLNEGAREYATETIQNNSISRWTAFPFQRSPGKG